MDAASHIKANGIQYTPSILAKFVAAEIWRYAGPLKRARVLDPAVGDGELIRQLLSVGNSLEVQQVTCFDTDSTAIEKTISLLSQFPNVNSECKEADFIAHVRDNFGIFETNDLFNGEPTPILGYDIAISNPPYVRTQVMGYEKSGRLSEEMGLSGRVDLYFAFIVGITRLLKENGVLGIIVSNRFMTTTAGKDIRAFILKNYEILHVWDFGDTKLFSASVLPAVLFLRKKTSKNPTAPITSIYRTNTPSSRPKPVNNLFDHLSVPGIYEINNQVFEIVSGVIKSPSPTSVWTVSNPARESWLATVRENSAMKFSDLGKIRVGIKTNNDAVYIRDDWETLGEAMPELLRPILTHHDAQCFRAALVPQKKVLYPYSVIDGRKVVVDLTDFPKSSAYLNKYRTDLEKREYLIKSRRPWYEIWVPQNPALWKLPKLVFWDIAEKPTFWLDFEGHVVNGDCYWLSCENEALLPSFWLALGIANSGFICEYYDRTFNNKLYAGRRRFMTQYVNEFPLPFLENKYSRRIIELSKLLYENHNQSSKKSIDYETEINQLVYLAFGLPIPEKNQVAEAIAV